MVKLLNHIGRKLAKFFCKFRDLIFRLVHKINLQKRNENSVAIIKTIDESPVLRPYLFAQVGWKKSNGPIAKAYSLAHMFKFSSNFVSKFVI